MRALSFGESFNSLTRSSADAYLLKDSCTCMSWVGPLSMSFLWGEEKMWFLEGERLRIVCLGQYDCGGKIVTPG